jgi:hypothetical protein
VKRGWRIVLIVAVCAAVAVIVALVWPGEKEPEYQGKKLSWWVMGVRDLSEGPGERAERMKALHEIGTNAFPYLIKSIRAASDAAPDNVDRAVSGIRKVSSRAWVSWIETRYRKNERCKDAVCVFRILGARARPAIPELVALTQSTNAAVSGAAVESLLGIREFDYQGPILPR